MTTDSQLGRAPAGVQAGVLPLAGVRVLDACRRAPFAGQLLSMLGADVVLLEDAQSSACRDDLDWVAFNAGKRSVVANWAAPAGQDALRRLIVDVDVFIDDSGEGFAGISPADVAPDVVYVSVTPFGLAGPRASWRGSELIAQAAGGILAISGAREFPPAMVRLPLAACMAGSQAAVAALLGLRGRDKTGRGARIDVSVQEAVADLAYRAQSIAWSDKIAEQRGPGGSDGSVPRQGLWPCKDGYVTWVLWTGPGWGRKNLPLIAWLQEEGIDEGLAEVPWEELSLATVDPAQFERWQSIFGRFFLTQSKQRLTDEARARRFLLYPINTMADVVADPLLVERGAWVDLRLPDGRSARAAGRPFRSSAYDVQLNGVVPAVGAGSDDAQPRRSRTTLAGPRAPTQTLPLAGLRVLDFSWALAGPITTKYLAYFGADVVKLEWRRRPDAARMTGPYPLGRPQMDGSAVFANHNAGKRSAGIDINHPEARELLLRLAAVADIVVENFTPGVMARHQLSYDDLRSVNPDLLMISLSLQGQTGSRATQPGLGSHLQALSGLDDLSGFPEGPPGGPHGVMPDMIGPWFALSALLAALDHRERTGEGQYIDLSQYEGLLTWFQPALLRQQLCAESPRRAGNISLTAAPHGVYPTAGDDRWLALAVESEAEWRALYPLLPAELQQAWPVDLSLDERLARRPALDAAIAGWTAGREGHALMRCLQEAGVPAYVVCDGLDLLADPQLAARGHYATPTHELIGPAAVDLPAFRIAGSNPEVTAGPRYGSSTGEFLREWLGLSDDEIGELLAASLASFG